MTSGLFHTLQTEGRNLKGVGVHADSGKHPRLITGRVFFIIFPAWT